MPCKARIGEVAARQKTKVFLLLFLQKKKNPFLSCRFLPAVKFVSQACWGGNGLGGSDGGYGGAGVVAIAGSLTNSGHISGGYGARLSAFRVAGGDGVSLDGAQLRNSGVITGGGGGPGGIGAYLFGDALLTNTGTIIGGAGSTFETSDAGGAGVVINGGTLTNAGTVSGGASGSGIVEPAVVFAGGGALVVDPGAAFNGDVEASYGLLASLDLAGTAQGTISGLGTSFVGFAAVNEAQGAKWTASGSNTIAAQTTLGVDGTLSATGMFSDSGTVTIGGAGDLIGAGTLSFLGPLVNGGLIEVASGSLSIAGTVTGSGAFAILAGGTLDLSRGAGDGQVLAFQGKGGTLDLGHVDDLVAPIAGFSAGDTIDLLKLVASGESFANGVLTLTDAGSTVATLTLDGTYASSSFSLHSDGHGGTILAVR